MATQLSDEEAYAGGALFSVALHARQGSYVVPDTERVRNELLKADESAKVLRPGRRAEAQAAPEAIAARRSFAETIMNPVECAEAAASAEQLVVAVLERLGVPQRLWKGLIQIPVVTSGLTVRASVDMYLSHLAPDPADQPVAGAGAELLHAKLHRIIQALALATFAKAPAAEEGEEAAPAGQKQQHDGAPDIPTLPTTVAAPIQRWLDARAAQAVADLIGLLCPRGADWEAESEALQAKAAAKSVERALRSTAAGAGLSSKSGKSKWSTGRVLAVGGTTVVAGTLLAVTGGLAAPAIAAGLSSAAGVFGGAAAASAVSGVATTAAVTTTMGVTGAGYGGAAMMYRTAAVREFGFLRMGDLLRANQIHVAVELQVTEPTGQEGSGWWRPVQVVLDVTDPCAETPAKKPESAFSKGLRSVFKRSGSSSSSSRRGGSTSRGPCDAISRSSSSGDLNRRASDAASEAGSEASSNASAPRYNGASKWRKWDKEDMHEIPATAKSARPDCTICVAGWIQTKTLGFVQPFESAMRRRRGYGEPEVYCLVWESKELKALHNAIMDLVGSYAGGQLAKYFMANFVSAGLVVAMAIPSSILLAMNIIDNSWSMALDRADKAGLLLAQRLAAMPAPHQRPVRLVGFSMGARLIFSCLLELARCGHRGIVAEVLIVGTPISLTPMKWASARSVVAGRFVNGYCGDDWLLGMVFRTSRAFIKTAAGLQPVSSACPEAGVEDVDLRARGLVKGHTDYPKQMSRILEDVGMGEASDAFGNELWTY